MTTFPDDALRALLSRTDPVASVYFDRRPAGEQDVALRWRLIADQLADQGAAPGVLEVLSRRVLESVPGPGVLAVFARADEVLLAVDMPGSDQPDSAVYAALPHLAPLLAWLQDRPAHVVAVVDRVGGDIMVYERGATEPITTVVTGPDDEIERNAPGGPSQMRYQHRAEDSWKHNAGLVAETLVRELRRADARLLLLAGDVRALQYLEEQLPARTRHAVLIRRVSGGRSPDGSEFRRAEQIRHETRLAADEERALLFKELAEGRGPGRRAVVGLRPTLAALAAGRAHTVLLAPEVARKRMAWFGPGPNDVAARPEALAPAREAAKKGHLDDVAVRAAILTGADVRILGPDYLDRPTDGIAALCRFTA